MDSFDKIKCIENIYSIAKKKNIKIGNLETKSGASKGYLSKLMKEDNTVKPSIELIMKIAKNLGVTIETLLYSNVNELTNDEFLLLHFFERLITKTSKNELIWIKHSSQEFSDIYPDVDTGEIICHPLSRPIRSGINNKITCGEFYSHFNINSVYEPSDCFFTCNHGNSIIYFIPVINNSNSLTNYKNHENIDYEYELYLIQNNNVDKVYHGYNNDSSTFDTKMILLYKAIIEASLHVHLDENVLDFINDFIIDTDDMKQYGSK